MLTNESMSENRYGRWAKARALVARIQRTLDAGGEVIVATPMKATRYTRKHRSSFRATQSGAYVLRGTRYECISYCSFVFREMVS